MKKTNTEVQKNVSTTQLPEQAVPSGNFSSIESFVEGFETHLTLEGKTLTTIKSYTCDIEVFLKYLAENNIHFVGQLERIHVTSYRDYLISQDVRAATINTKIKA